MAALLSVSNLVTAFASGEVVARAVRGVSFDLDRGETVALVGESGCGKTVTALSILRLLPPSARILEGSVVFDGIDLTAASSQEVRGIRGRRIAMVFQDSMTSLNPLLTVGRQITESMEAHLGLSHREASRRATGLLEEVGVPEPARRLKQYPFQLSGGLRQRVAIAVALSSDPEMLIADEPTTALDVTIQAQVLELLKREQEMRGMSLLLITHDLGVVARTVDRVHVLYAGRIVEEAPTGRLFAEPRHPYTLGLLRSIPGISGEVQERLPSIPGNPPPISNLPKGCPFRPRCSFAVDRCREVDPALRSTGEGSAAACWVDVREVIS